MEKKKTFSYTYSANQNAEVQAIRKKYLPKKESRLDELKRLDHTVQSAGMVKSLSVGIIGCLIFGISMCIGLDVLSGGTVLAVLLGIIGAAIMISAYPIYMKISQKAKTEYTPRILQLAEEIEKNI